MITEVQNLGDGMQAYRTFAFAFATPATRSKTKAWQFGAGPLTSTRPASHTPIPMQNGSPLYVGEPKPDFQCGDKSFCTINSVSRASGAEHGFCLDSLADGSIKPDLKVVGQTLFTAGESANRAASTLKKAYTDHLAKTQTKKPFTGHALTSKSK
jgi:hypothetical protein